MTTRVALTGDPGSTPGAAPDPTAVGLGGCDRRAARSVERARICVTRAIRDAITRIRKHEESLGHHLSNAIKAGAFCAPVTWES